LVQIVTGRKQKTEIKSSYITKSAYSNCGRVKHAVPQGTIFGPLLFLTCIKDLPPTLNTSSTPIIFVDDNSVLILSEYLNDFCI
jgi:hypothetical protein